jgi:hypothetical protein
MTRDFIKRLSLVCATALLLTGCIAQIRSTLPLVSEDMDDGLPGGAEVYYMLNEDKNELAILSIFGFEGSIFGSGGMFEKRYFVDRGELGEPGSNRSDTVHTMHLGGTRYLISGQSEEGGFHFFSNTLIEYEDGVISSFTKGPGSMVGNPDPVVYGTLEQAGYFIDVQPYQKKNSSGQWEKHDFEILKIDRPIPAARVRQMFNEIADSPELKAVKVGYSEAALKRDFANRWSILKPEVDRLIDCLKSGKTVKACNDK